jgi:hypothetical protein
MHQELQQSDETINFSKILKENCCCGDSDWCQKLRLRASKLNLTDFSRRSRLKENHDRQNQPVFLNTPVEFGSNSY